MTLKSYIEHLFSSFQGVMSQEDSVLNFIEEVVRCEGKIVVSGLGKTGIIGKKFSATLSSLGIPSFFLHCAEAVHGDLGAIGRNDLIVLISQSGNSPEIKNILQSLRAFDNKIIGITSNRNSVLFNNSNLSVDIAVSSECSLHEYAPTYSTTVLLAILDFVALKSSILMKKGVLIFSKNHPGGSLGLTLRSTLRELMVDTANFEVDFSMSLAEVSVVMGQSGLGCAIVKSDNEKVGLITDGDLRRLVGSEEFKVSILTEEMINWNPHFVEALDLDLIIREFDNSGKSLLLYREGMIVYAIKKF